MTHVAEEGNRRKGGMTGAEIGQSMLGGLSMSLVQFPFLDMCVLVLCYLRRRLKNVPYEYVVSKKILEKCTVRVS